MAGNARRPGVRTTEFWISLVVALAGGLSGAGLFGEGSLAAQIVGGVLAVGASLGYTYVRGQVKRTELEVDGATEEEEDD